MRALQARINPHFLFNSMNTIASLVRRDPATAERAVEDLSDLFRAALGAGQGESSLDEEIHLAQRYLAIEKLRLGERLQTRFELADDLPRTLVLPRLILQPLVENAVIHGISRLVEGGTIELLARVEGRELRIEVRIASPVARTVVAGIATRRTPRSASARFGPRALLATDAGDGYYAYPWLRCPDLRMGVPAASALADDEPLARPARRPAARSLRMCGRTTTQRIV